MERIIRSWWKCEPFLFALFVLITAIPVIGNQYFPTVDGPAHLHNANLLKHYFFYNDEFILDFFDLNRHLNSNFVDHVWFALFGLFLPTYLVEKSILLFYVLFLPFSFRYLVKQIVNEKNSAAISAYLIFPFVYSFTFRIGFFNFCMGIPVLFWTLGYWMKHRADLNKREIIWLTILTTIVYATHIFNFMLLGILLFVNEIQHVINRGTLKGIIKTLRIPVLIFLPGILLTCLFLLSNSAFEHAPPSYLSKEKLTETLINVSPAITLSYEKEVLYARIIGCSLCVLGAFVIYTFFKTRKKNVPPKPQWLFSLIVVLLLFYIFPDWIASGGFISIRWALFFFLVLILLIAAKGLAPKLLALPIAVLLINHLFFIDYHNKETAILSEYAETLVSAEEFMDGNKLLLPLNYSQNWMHINHANYMATEKNIINLDNYEPTKPHFPLIWKQGEQVYDLMQKYGNRNPPCINIDNYESKTHHRIDYLSRFCFDGNVSDSCTALVEAEIKSRFDLVYTSENNKLQLYKRK
ncbi:MAG: hypothetical protein K0S44_22 [Bacteroidetes bacterium]|jgi:hypothetical protein|nr:hypothetical protein [Bacteroidota bacterium]